MVKVSNEIGATQSNTVSAFAADTPATPANPVTFDADHTNTTSIRVIMDQIDDDGGAEILSYHLQRTEPGGSAFFDVVGSSQNLTLDTEAQVTSLTKRRSYRFRYRTINSVGPSDWSEEAFLVPAVKPERPP